jgi:tetratricopeptide (TPR) repeat protein
MEGQGPPSGGGFGGPGAGQFGGPNQGPGGPFPPPQGEEGFRGQGPGEGFGFGPGMRSRMPEMDPEKHFQKLREMGEDGYEKAIKFFEKAIGFLKEKEIKINEDAIKKYEEAKKLHEKGNLDAAFDSLHDAFMILRDSMPRPENHPRLGREDDKRGKEQGRKSKFDKGRSGKELSREEREKVEAAFKSLKSAYDKYVDKFGEDEYINEQFENFKKLERNVRRGEISVADAIKKLKSMEKEVQKKLEEEK